MVRFCSRRNLRRPSRSLLLRQRFRSRRHPYRAGEVPPVLNGGGFGFVVRISRTLFFLEARVQMFCVEVVPGMVPSHAELKRPLLMLGLRLLCVGFIPSECHRKEGLPWSSASRSSETWSNSWLSPEVFVGSVSSGMMLCSSAKRLHGGPGASQPRTSREGVAAAKSSWCARP